MFLRAFWHVLPPQGGGSVSCDGGLGSALLNLLLLLSLLDFCCCCCVAPPRQIEFLNDPIKVTVGSAHNEATANVRITQNVEVIEDRARDARLLALLKQHHGSRKNRVLVFGLYKKECARMETMLQKVRPPTGPAPGCRAPPLVFLAGLGGAKPLPSPAARLPPPIWPLSANRAVICSCHIETHPL